MKVYQRIASLLAQIENCVKSDNEKWEEKALDELESIADCYLPHGSGFDSGSHIDTDASTREEIIIHSSYHHMNEYGGYCGWTEFTVTVTPSLMHGFTFEFENVQDDDDEYFGSEFQHRLSAIYDNPKWRDSDIIIRQYVQIVEKFLNKQESFSVLREATKVVKTYL